MAVIFPAGSFSFSVKGLDLNAAFRMAQVCCHSHYDPSTTSFPGFCVAQVPSVLLYFELFNSKL